MSKLRNLGSAVGALMPPLSRPSDAHGHSRALEPWRAWFNLARWRRLRMKVFTRDLFTCQMPNCGLLEGDTSKLVADHKIPHRGNPALFWDEDNIQTLCKPCHDSAKQAGEAAQRRRGG